MNRQTFLACTLLALPGLACAQSASVALTSSDGTTVSAGQTVTISVVPATDTAGAGAGVFGAPGFYGFGGNVTASGSAAVVASAPVTDSMLTSGVTVSLAAGSALVRAGAGRGLLGGLAADPPAMLTFDLAIDAAASDGDTVTLDFDGAVVLVLGDALVTFSTAPGPGQSSLMTSSLVLTVGGACSAADVTTDGIANGMPDGAVTLSDFSYYLSLWGASDSVADVTTDGTSNGVPDGVVTLSDFSFYLSLWGAGCP